MVVPNPADVLTRRVRDALEALFVASFTERSGIGSAPPAPVDRSSLTDRQRYHLDVLASVTFGFAWAPPLLAIAVSTAFEWYGGHPAALEGFAGSLRAALSEMVRHLGDLVDRGDLDSAEPDLQLVRHAAQGAASRESIATAVEDAFKLYSTGAYAPQRRLQEADFRTPYFVAVDAPSVYAAVIRPYGYDEDEWEYDLGSLSPDLVTLRRRSSAGFFALGDDVLVGFAEVSLHPAGAWEAGARQTEVCDAAVRETDGRESYDLHSFSASGAGICETVSDYPIEPHPAGPIVRQATVRLVLLRHIALEAGD